MEDHLLILERLKIKSKQKTGGVNLTNENKKSKT